MRAKLSILDLQRWSTAVLVAGGMQHAHGAAAASLIVRSDIRGRATHGVARLGSYVEMMNQGLLNPRPRMSHDERHGAIVFEADGALGHVAAPEIIALGIAALRTQGNVLVVVREIGHLGSLGIHALAAAEAGAFCLVGQQAPPVMAMPGFTRAALGNNPIAFACPMPNGDPLVFDMACSEAARGHILLAARERRAIPEGWAVDEAGEPTTDPQRALRGALLPAGGHKGMGIAMMVEVLAAALGANAASMARPRPRAREGGGSSRVGAFFWFVDPGVFGNPALFDAYMEQWTGFYLASGREAGRLPGQRAAALERAARETGIQLSGATVRELRVLGENLGVPFPA
ncbi:MAG TPA: Ldh family oxidoreductase [Burkholderiales bacterium]|nr:Ldh family oxidoreductase [Burkholderiales bacterium]